MAAPLQFRATMHCEVPCCGRTADLPGHRALKDSGTAVHHTERPIRTAVRSAAENSAKDAKWRG
ncbi:hypothetical protein GCM10027203_10710 [Nonomuraea fastidiosa]